MSFHAGMKPKSRFLNIMSQLVPVSTHLAKEYGALFAFDDHYPHICVSG